jgi:hypothetical protein
VQPYLSLQPELSEMDQMYRRFGFAGGFLCRRELAPPIVIDPSSIISHIAVTPLLIKEHKVLHILPMDRVCLFSTFRTKRLMISRTAHAGRPYGELDGEGHQRGHGRNFGRLNGTPRHQDRHTHSTPWIYPSPFHACLLNTDTLLTLVHVRWAFRRMYTRNTTTVVKDGRTAEKGAPFPQPLALVCTHYSSTFHLLVS